MSDRPPHDPSASPRPPAPSRPRRRERPDRRSLHRHARRVAVTIAGFTLIIAGIVLAMPLVPGPGGLVIIAGLAILATEFEWAERWLQRARRRWEDAARRAGVDPRAATAGAIIIVLGVAAVMLWLALR